MQDTTIRSLIFPLRIVISPVQITLPNMMPNLRDARQVMRKSEVKSYGGNSHPTGNDPIPCEMALLCA